MNTGSPIVTEFDLQLPSGRIRVRRTGSPTAPLTLLIHGLSAHLHSFDFLVDHLAAENRQLVAVDLRGRGRSEMTAPGSYGLDAHCRDVLDIATQLGAEQFDLIGWSMGALIGLDVAAKAPLRLRKLVLIDHAGDMDSAPVEKIIKGLDRLDLVMLQPALYLDAIRLGGTIKPWSAFWDNYYNYELQPTMGGYQPSTNRLACLEDLHDLQAADFPSIWKSVRAPTLLIRCQVPVGGGFIVPEKVRDQIRQAMPQIQIAEVPFDHYIVLVDDSTAHVIDRFLD